MTEGLLPCFMSVTGEMLPEALTYLRHCGAKVQTIRAEAVSFRVEFLHLGFGGETQLLCTRDVERGMFVAAIKAVGLPLPPHAKMVSDALLSLASAIEARSDAAPQSDAAEGESAVGDSRDAQSTASTSPEATTLNDAQMEKGQDQ